MHVPPDPVLMGRLKPTDLMAAVQYFTPKQEA